MYWPPCNLSNFQSFIHEFCPKYPHIVSVNPFGKKLPDKFVRDKYKQFSGKWDADLEDTGLPDKFSLECVEEFLWKNGNYSIKKV